MSVEDDTWSPFQDELVRPVERRAEQVKARAMATPAARTAGVEWDGHEGEIRTGPVTQPPNDWADLIRTMEMDPDEVEVVPGSPVKHSAWQVPGHGLMHSYRATIQRKSAAQERLDFDELAERISKHRPQKREAPVGENAFVVCTGDTQIGKEGTAETIDRFLSSLSTVPARLKELRKSGRSLGTIYAPWLGDCIEHVVGSYASQTATTELSLTEQLRVLKRLAWKQVEVLAPLTKRLVIPVVPGNHDQAVRKGGDQLGHQSDSFAYDLAAFLHDMSKVNPLVYGHVEVVVPERKSLVVTQDICGTMVAMTHGHQFPSGSDGVSKWWATQAHGMQPAGEATLLLAAHRHHLDVRQLGPKTFIQIPALDSGSQWWVNKTGQDSPAGIVTLTVGAAGWDDLKIIQ